MSRIPRSLLSHRILLVLRHRDCDIDCVFISRLSVRRHGRGTQTLTIIWKPLSSVDESQRHRTLSFLSLSMLTYRDSQQAWDKHYNLIRLYEKSKKVRENNIFEIFQYQLEFIHCQDYVQFIVPKSLGQCTHWFKYDFWIKTRVEFILKNPLKLQYLSHDFCE